jgi:hypothetical protein
MEVELMPPDFAEKKAKKDEQARKDAEVSGENGSKFVYEDATGLHVWFEDEAP